MSSSCMVVKHLPFALSTRYRTRGKQEKLVWNGGSGIFAKGMSAEFGSRAGRSVAYFLKHLTKTVNVGQIFFPFLLFWV